MNRSKFTSIAAKLSIALASFIGVTAFAQVPRSNHVYIVAEENRSYERTVGSVSMPYLNSLLAKGAVATQFYSNMHGSLENYLIVTSGQYLTHNNDTLAVFNVDNIERHLLTNGKTFKSYAQTLPFAGYTGLFSGAYMKRHAPLPYFTEMANSSLIKNHVSTTELAKDIANGTLPNFAFITPDGNNDMHNCGANLGACFWTADQFLKNTIGPLLASAPFQPGGDGVLIIWADEADLGSDNRCSATVLTGCGGHILVAMIGPQVKAGYKSTTTYHHQSVLRTMLEALGTTANFPSAANTAPDMREFFKGNTGTATTASSVTISSPTGSTVTGPGVGLAASATAPNPVTFMRIYVDNVSVASASTSKISATVSMSKAKHSLVFQAWDSKGNVYKASRTITVQ
ncbi:MAG TPA: alkaline phosphatase family protein [Candidatus Angelobacter sp.]|jgi:acid phosphatase|nr:alkaline phosphatase family protein [Candidatus Angelobacter sp.]